MIIIRTLLDMICINENEEFVIYQEGYYGDEMGNPVTIAEEIIDDKEHFYGNIFIVTPNKRYTYRKVFAAYAWVINILDYLEKHRNEENIFIDLNKLFHCQDGGFCEFLGQLEVESL